MSRGVPETVTSYVIEGKPVGKRKVPQYKLNIHEDSGVKPTLGPEIHITPRLTVDRGDNVTAELNSEQLPSSAGGVGSGSVNSIV